MSTKRKNLIQMIIFILVGMVSLILVLSLKNFNNSFNIIMVLVYIGLCTVPQLLQLIFKWVAPIYISISYYLFLVLSTLLGTVFDFYELIAVYDIILHAMSGVLLGCFGMYIYLKQTTGSTNSLICILVILGVATICGVLWECWEFTTDAILDLNSQKHSLPDGTKFVGHEALKDTMYDLISDLGGAILVTIGFLIGHYRRKRNLQPSKNKSTDLLQAKKD